MGHKQKMAEVRVHATFTVNNVDQFLMAAKILVEKTQQEEGCIHYDLYKENGCEKSYAMIETWTTAAALERHSKSEHVKQFQADQKENLQAVVKSFVKV